MSFTAEQVQQLLRPIAPSRVLSDGKGHSHVSQQDVVAHLIRIFGFGNFDVEITGPDLIFETERVNNQGVGTGRWDCCYRAKARLIIKNPDGTVICHFDGSATGFAQNQSHGDAHDLAMKSAESVAKKRAATNLGDQFGLSLYNKGQLEALVRGSLVLPASGEGDDAKDVQDGVPQQVAMGHDEIDRELDGSGDGRGIQQTGGNGQQRPAAPAGQRTDHMWLTGMEQRIAAATSRQALAELANEITKVKVNGGCEKVHEEHLWSLGRQRQAALDISARPTNLNGSTSRSRASDEQLAANGEMTSEQQKAHNAMVRDTYKNTKLAERSTSADPNDPWASIPPGGDDPWAAE